MESICLIILLLKLDLPIPRPLSDVIAVWQDKVISPLISFSTPSSYCNDGSPQRASTCPGFIKLAWLPIET
ncbi:hypothetical protein U1Q18_019755, partial [Sarracenia purpurea var. burkii]